MISLLSNESRAYESLHYTPDLAALISSTQVTNISEGPFCTWDDNKRNFTVTPHPHPHPQSRDRLTGTSAWIRSDSRYSVLAACPCTQTRPTNNIVLTGRIS